MKTKKSSKKKHGWEQVLIKTGKGVSYILECRYCSRKVPTSLHSKILSKLQRSRGSKDKKHFLVCKECFPHYMHERKS